MKLVWRLKRKGEAYTFILPGFIYLLIICRVSVLYNIILSFKNVNVKILATGDLCFCRTA